MVEYDIDICIIEMSKHFRNKYMRRWGWDVLDLREAIKHAYKVEKVRKKKYEIYTKKQGSKKVIFVYEQADKTMFIISGAEGK